jgi:hypothetical protein
MAFDRVVELKIGERGQGLLISDLDIEFEVSRSNTFELNTCRLTIYNAKESTRKNVLKRGNNVNLAVGYQDEGTGTIFIGNIDEVVSVQKNAEWVTSISALSLRSLNQPFEHLTVSLSYGPGVSISQPLRALATSLGVVLLGVENAGGVILDNGWCFAGTARQALMDLEKRLKAYNVGLYQDNAEIVIFRKGNVDSRFRGVLLTKQSGLIFVKEKIDDSNNGDAAVEDKKIIEFQSLINPAIQPNGLIVIQGEDTLDGSYLVEKTVYRGNNFGGDFRLNGEAIA